MISAGFDSREGDPLGRFRLSDADFTDLTKIMLEIAGTHANGRLVSVLEGGYDLSGLEAAVAAHVKRIGVGLDVSGLRSGQIFFLEECCLRKGFAV